MNTNIKNQNEKMLSGSLDIQSIDFDFDKNLYRKQMRKTIKEIKK